MSAKKSKGKSLAKQDESTPRYSPEYLAHQWKPGQSGNPSGRAKGVPTMFAAHRELLGEPAPKELCKQYERFMPQHWRRKDFIITWRHLQVLRDRIKAVNLKAGDFMSKLIWEMLEGKAVQPIGGPKGGPIPMQSTTVSFDLSKLSATELRRLREARELLAKAVIVPEHGEGDEADE